MISDGNGSIGLSHAVKLEHGASIERGYTIYIRFSEFGDIRFGADLALTINQDDIPYSTNLEWIIEKNHFIAENYEGLDQEFVNLVSSYNEPDCRIKHDVLTSVDYQFTPEETARLIDDMKRVLRESKSRCIDADGNIDILDERDIAREHRGIARHRYF